MAVAHDQAVAAPVTLLGVARHVVLHFRLDGLGQEPLRAGPECRFEQTLADEACLLRGFDFDDLVVGCIHGGSWVFANLHRGHPAALSSTTSGDSSLTRKDKLKEGQLPRLEAALRDNEPLLKGYLLKEALRELWTQPDAHSARRYLAEWLQLARDTGIRIFQRLAQTFAGYTEGILAWWRHRISSGPMEGINNKIKTMLRKAYGLRDERFFMLRLYALHKAHYKFIG